MTSPRVALEQQLQMEKQQLRMSLETLSDRASDAVDWRQQVRRHPVETLGAALVLGAIIGALTSRSAMRIRSGRDHRTDEMPARQAPPSAGRADWHRLRAGLVGVVTDRALVVAQDFMERATQRSSVPTTRPLQDRTVRRLATQALSRDHAPS